MVPETENIIFEKRNNYHSTSARSYPKHVAISGVKGITVNLSLSFLLSIGVLTDRNLLNIYFGWSDANRQSKSFKQIIVETKIRPFPFYIEGDFVNGKDFILFDIPTTMYASYLSIKKIFSEEFLARENKMKFIQSKEIENFERTLKIMVPDYIEKKYFKFSILK